MKISVIGVGNMGRAIVSGLRFSGHEVTVFNRTRSKVEDLRENGVRVVDSAAEALAASDYTIAVLLDEQSTRSTLLNDETRLALRGKALISGAAISPEEAISLANDVAEMGGRLSELVVTTYPDKVEERQSQFLISAHASDSFAWQSIFGGLGDVFDMGEIGNAAKAQMAGWLSYMFITIGIGYAVAGCERQGLPVDALRAVLTNNPALAMPGADYIVPEMAQRKYGSNRWSVDNMIISIDNAMRFAARLGIDTSVMHAIRNVYIKASEIGYGKQDVTALYEAINPRLQRPVSVRSD
jgi:3-hydroxyisobutyrate dehydrogenase-like beta-hydroxyacid dehydrogenase